ncbi:MAG: hypothetical protein AB7N76_12775 [Planctomycetota bacterium]
MTASRLFALGCALLLLLPAAARADDLVPAERKQLERVAGVWLKLAKSALKRHLAADARTCLERAQEAVGAVAPPVAALARALDAAKDEGKDSARAAQQRAEAKTRGEAAKLYDELAGARGLPAARAGRYAWRALREEPSAARWARLGPVLGASWSGGAKAEACALAKQALALDPPPPAEVRAALERLERLEAVGKVVLRRASKHAMRYYLALPASYDPDAKREWPVLVTVDGAGCGFEGSAQAFAKTRGELPCLVVAPCGFANTNAIEGGLEERYLGWYDAKTLAKAEQDRFEFDRAGLLAVLDDLRAEYHAAAQVCITGFSGGGNLTYQMVFLHPERLLAAAPACANFTRSQWGGVQRPAADRDFPLLILTGGKDPHRQWTFGKEGSPGIEPQTDAAMQALERAGHKRVKRTMIPELTHSPACQEVVDFLRPYLSGEKKRADGP